MEEYDNKAVADRIRECRKHRGLTQEQVAQWLGMNRANISNYEGGRVVLPADSLYKLAQILSVSADYLLTGSYTVFENQEACKISGDYLRGLEEKVQKYEKALKGIQQIMSKV